MRELRPNSSSDPTVGFATQIADLASRAVSVEASAQAARRSSAWYALSVKHQHERSIEMALIWKGFEAFSPMYRARRQWSDRTQEIDMPLFAGYVFCKFPFESKGRVLDTPAVSRVVHFGGTPAIVSNEEIDVIRAMIASKLPLRPWPHLKPGDRVRVERGPLRGITGVLLKEKDTLELIVSIELLQRSVAVELDATAVVPVAGSHSRASA